VNLTGAIDVLRASMRHDVTRFVFASSMSVYGSSPRGAPLTEDAPATPDEPYGAAKRAIELLGESLADLGAIEFVALRIARVVGPGIRSTASPWRSQLFGAPSDARSIRLPFGPDARLSLVHVEEVARMLGALVDARRPRRRIYNTPAEQWRVADLRAIVHARLGVPVELSHADADGGPLGDGTRFAEEFAFQLRGLDDWLPRGPAPA
jgi:nucleoside-diphosphate-sugar epimerase